MATAGRAVQHSHGFTHRSQAKPSPALETPPTPGTCSIGAVASAFIWLVLTERRRCHGRALELTATMSFSVNYRSRVKLSTPPPLPLLAVPTAPIPDRSLPPCRPATDARSAAEGAACGQAARGHLWPSRCCPKMRPGPWMLTATTPPSSSTTAPEIGLLRRPLLCPLRRPPRTGPSRHRLRLVERHRLGMRLGPLLSSHITTRVAGVHLAAGSGRSPASPARPI
jgi:hypothetical protein